MAGNDFKAIPSGSVIKLNRSLAAPQNLQVALGTPPTTALDLAWDDKTSGEDNFLIYRATGHGSTSFSLIATVAANSTTYSDSGLTPDTIYVYKMRAIRGTQYSDYTDPVEFQTDLAYQPGYPTSLPVEPNVVAQWLFDEASGNAVDTVSAISLPKSGAGSLTYNQTASGNLFSVISPGILTASDAVLYNASHQASCDPGTGDFSIELWLASANMMTNKYFFSTGDGSDKGFELSNNSSTNIRVYTKTQDLTVLDQNFNHTTDFNDGDPHKIRIVWDRGNAILELFIDGVSKGQKNLSSLAGKTIQVNNISVGGYAGVNATAPSTFYSARLSLNATNNAGGPNGG